MGTSYTKRHSYSATVLRAESGLSAWTTSQQLVVRARLPAPRNTIYLLFRKRVATLDFTGPNYEGVAWLFFLETDEGPFYVAWKRRCAGSPAARSRSPQSNTEKRPLALTVTD